MPSSQSPRVVLLTGASGGIGQVMTEALLAAGHAVAAVDRDAAALTRLAAQHGGVKDRLHPIVADLATAAGCDSAVAEARARFGAIEAVINNAGIGMSSVRPDAEARAPGIAELTPEIWDGFMAIFVRAPVMLLTMRPKPRRVMSGSVELLGPHRGHGFERPLWPRRRA